MIHFSVTKCHILCIGSINERSVSASWYHETITFTIFILVPPLLYLFGFVLLMVAWRHQTVSIDAFIVGRCVAMGTGAGLLHGQEGADALDLALEAAVGQSLAFWGQSTRGHPLSVLLLLEAERVRLWSERWDKDRGGGHDRMSRTEMGRCVCVCPHVFTAQIDLVHALGRRYQESD